MVGWGRQWLQGHEAAGHGLCTGRKWRDEYSTQLAFSFVFSPQSYLLGSSFVFRVDLPSQVNVSGNHLSVPPRCVSLVSLDLFKLTVKLDHHRCMSGE